MTISGKTPGGKAGSRRWGLMAVVAMLAAGALFTRWTVAQADRRMRKELLLQGRMVGQALDVERVKALAGTAADLKNRDYQRLKAQLARVRQANPDCRFLYLLGRRPGGEVFFYIDSEAVDSEDYSPPGQPFTEASELLRRAFDSGGGDVEGPIRDQWGTWVSALVPLQDPATGRRLALLGMDIDARTWKRAIAIQALLPVVLLLALLILAAFWLVAARSRTRLRESEEKFRAITASALDAIVMMDPDGNVSFWNKASERIFGYTQREAMGRNLHALIAPPRFQEAHLPRFAEFRKSGQGAAIGQMVELQGMRKDGSEFPVDLSLAAINQSGRWAAVGIIRDSSERKRAEAMMGQANEKLSAMVDKLEALSMQSNDLREMGGFLLSCSTIAEVQPVIMRSMKKLFPGTAGALLLLSPSRTDLETAVKWGEFPDDDADNVFSPDACWGLTRGGSYLSAEAGGGLACRHLQHALPAAYACLPLMAKGEVLGLLHIRKPTPASPEAARLWLAGLKDVSSELSELLSLSIANIRLREKLSIQSIRDPLTGLFNRRYMEESFQKEILRAARRQEPVGVIMLDIDHFKTFNDLHGHGAGDAVLVALAGLFKQRLRGADSACRYGGEEFALILPESSLEHTGRRAGQLAEEIKALRVPYGGETLGPITLSLGVAAYPLHGGTPEELLRAADAALYRAKQQGRDRVVLA